MKEEYKILIGSPSEVQKKLNQWLRLYLIKIESFHLDWRKEGPIVGVLLLRKKRTF